MRARRVPHSCMWRRHPHRACVYAQSCTPTVHVCMSSHAPPPCMCVCPVVHPHRACVYVQSCTPTVHACMSSHALPPCMCVCPVMHPSPEKSLGLLLNPAPCTPAPVAPLPCMPRSQGHTSLHPISPAPRPGPHKHVMDAPPAPPPPCRPGPQEHVVDAGHRVHHALCQHALVAR